MLLLDLFDTTSDQINQDKTENVQKIICICINIVFQHTTVVQITNSLNVGLCHLGSLAHFLHVAMGHNGGQTVC